MRYTFNIKVLLFNELEYGLQFKTPVGPCARTETHKNAPDHFHCRLGLEWLDGISNSKAQLELGHQYILKHSIQSNVTDWLELVYAGVKETNFKYPFIAYGTDWLAFAHLILAVAFVGPWRDPIKNIWVVQFGLIACAAVFPLALIAGEVRGIPIFWRLIDCSFGLFGGVVLWLCYKKIVRVVEATNDKSPR